MKGVTVVLITKNEEYNVRGCLDSVQGLGPIVVVDAFSQDRTAEIARKYTDGVYQKPWKGFAAQKNFAFSKADTKWIFIIDADERATSELIEEIRQVVMSDTGITAYYVARKNIMYGRWVRYGGSYPDWQLRLARREGSCYSGEIHERLNVPGDRAYLKNPLIHYSKWDISERLLKTDKYTTLAVKERIEEGDASQMHWFNLIINPAFDFFKMYVLKKGFMDGLPGFILAAFSSFYNFLKYAKLWEHRLSSTK